LRQQLFRSQDVRPVFIGMEVASNVGPNGRILAFEHDTFSFGLLQSRMKSAGIVNIEAYQLALGDKTRRASFTAARTTASTTGSVSTNQEPNVEASEVQVSTLGEFISSRAVPALDGLK
jgi:FkbM family methyltransferase